MFLLKTCLDKKNFNNTNARQIKRTALTKTIDIDIYQEIKTNPKRAEIIRTIIKYIDDILASHGNYRTSLVSPSKNE